MFLGRFFAKYCTTFSFVIILRYKYDSVTIELKCCLGYPFPIGSSSKLPSRDTRLFPAYLLSSFPNTP